MHTKYSVFSVENRGWLEKRLLSHIRRFTIIGSEQKKQACDIKVYDLAYVVPRLVLRACTQFDMRSVISMLLASMDLGSLFL